VDITECAAFVDASGQPWYEVPGYGQVQWHTWQISEHARFVLDVHRPGQAAIRVRITWRGLPLIVWPGRLCKLCQTKWQCREVRWARRWLTAVRPGERQVVGAES
jgi:hypothetical protein